MSHIEAHEFLIRARNAQTHVPDALERQQFISDYFDRLEKTLTEEISDIGKTRSYARYVGEVIHSTDPIGVTLYMINQSLVQPYGEAAAICHERGRVADFVYWYDVHQGLTFVLAGISMGQNAVNGIREDDINSETIKSWERVTGKDMDIITGAETYAQLDEDTQRLADAFRQDMKGFAVLDYYLAEVEDIITEQAQGQNNISSVPEYFRAGAQLAAKIYRRLYPEVADVIG